jgi:hypothetical protein
MTEMNSMGDIISLDARRAQVQEDQQIADAAQDESVEWETYTTTETYEGNQGDYAITDLPDGNDVEESGLFWTGVDIPEKWVDVLVYEQEQLWKRDRKRQRRASQRGHGVAHSYHQIPDADADFFFRILGLMRDAKISSDPEISERILNLTMESADYAINVRSAAAAYNLDECLPKFFDKQGRLLDWCARDLH